MRDPCYGLVIFFSRHWAFTTIGTNLYLDKPYQFFYDKPYALNWATQEDAVLITSSEFSDQDWECAVKGHHWQAVIPRKVPFSNAPSSSR